MPCSALPDDLLIALHAGMHEDQLWSSFLTLLKARTNSDYASLIFLQGDVPIHEATELFAGRDVRTEGRRRGQEDLFRTDPIRYRLLQSGKVYKVNELMNLDDPEQAAFRQAYLERGGVEYSRYMRVGDPQGVSAWLIILRDSCDFSSADESRLEALARHLAIAVRNFSTLETARFQSVMSERALRHAGICWAAFDKDGRFISADPQGETMMAEITGHSPILGQRLMPIDDATDRAIIQACADFAENTHAYSRVANIGPPFDLKILLSSFRSRPLTGLALPTMMALWRADKPAGQNIRADMLTTAFGFNKSEARFAISLLKGRSIKDAATDNGLTIMSARQYSKSLFAKAQAKGQPDLIRILLRALPL